jgi:hypothetical protein
VFWVVADALAELREFSAQLVEWPLPELAGGTSAGLCVGAVRWRTGGDVVDAVEGEVVVVTAAHGGIEAFDGGSLVAKFGGLVGRDVGALEFAFGWGVDEEQLGRLPCAGEGGVGPVAGEVIGVPHDAGPLHGAALDGVRGQRVGVLEMLAHVGGVEAALGAGVGAHEDVLLGRVDGDDGPARAVVDRSHTVVAAGDDPVPHGELLAGDVDALPQPAVALQFGTDEGVEALAALVVACDEDGLAPPASCLALAPRGDRRTLARAGTLRVLSDDAKTPGAVLLGDVVGGVAAVDVGEELALARVALAHDVAQLVGAQAPGQ